MKDDGEKLRNLGDALENNPGSIQATDSELILNRNHVYIKKPVPISVLDSQMLIENLTALSRALQSREEMESCLQEAGMKGLIKS